ncbi:Uncharacterised protein [Mycobacteroides abscessus subsp. abscessus]|nr:Uncharacterised protein [Mycobacteroides abscessus subsp. abscessus]
MLCRQVLPMHVREVRGTWVGDGHQGATGDFRRDLQAIVDERPWGGVVDILDGFVRGEIGIRTERTGAMERIE